MSPIPLIDPALPGLCIAQPTRAEPFLAESPRMRFVGRQTRAGGRVLVRDGDGLTQATVALLAEGIGRAANLVLYPGVSRRDFAGPRGSVVESVVVARTLPLLAWRLSGSTLGGTRVEVDLAPAAAEPVVERTEAGLVVRAGTHELRLGVWPAPAEPQITSSGGAIRASIELSDEEATTITLACGTSAEAETAGRAVPHLHSHALGAARGAEEVLRVESGIEAVDDGLSWALARAAGLATEGGGEALSLGLASIALGYAPVAERVIDRLRHSEPVVAALLAARLSSTLGRTHSAAEIAADLLAPSGPQTGDLLPLAADSLADALQFGATPEVLAALRRVAATPTASLGVAPAPTTAPDVASPAPRAVALPMARGGSTRAAWLRSVLRGDPDSPPLVADVPSSRARQAAAAFRVDPDRAWADWRALLDEGLAGGPTGPATWDDWARASVYADTDPGADRSSATAELILAFAHGMLGLAPDAPVGRLRLAPRMPRHLTSFSTTGIPIGDGSIRMRYERDERELRFTLEPERIGVPPLLVFEPSVAGEVEAVSLDGSRVELDLRPKGGRTVVPIQLPLEGRRALSITVG